MKEVQEAIRALRQKRSELLSEVTTIDKTLASLEAFQGGAPIRRGGGKPRSAESVYSLTLEWLRSMASADWSAAEIIEGLAGRGKPLTVKDPMNAVRSALSRAERMGEIRRIREGRYQFAMGGFTRTATPVVSSLGYLEGYKVEDTTPIAQ